MHPILLITCYSGNIGKTVISKNVFAPNMQNARIFAVEDINAGYGQGEATQLSGEQTHGILEQAIAASFDTPVIVDVGASNVSIFFETLTGYEGIQEYISRVIVPTDPSDKVQIDTISTLKYLIDELNFDSDKISLLLNKAPSRKSEDQVFGSLVKQAAELGVFVLGTIPENETFQTASKMGKTIHQLAALDPKTILAESKANVEKGGDPKAGVSLMLAAASAKKLKKVLDDIYSRTEF